MPAITTKDFVLVVLDRVEPGINNYINDKTQIKKLLTKFETKRWKGENVLKHKMKLGLAGQVHPAKEMQNLGKSYPSSFTEITAEKRKMQGQLVLSQETVMLRKNKEVLLNTLLDELEDFQTGAGMDFDSYCWGDGTGIFAIATGAPTGNWVPLQSAKFLRDELLMTAVDKATETIIADDLKIKQVDWANNRFELVSIPAGVTINANTEFYPINTFTTAYDVAVLGLAVHFGNTDPRCGKYQGHLRADDIYMQAIQLYGSTPGTPEPITMRRFQSVAFRMSVDRAGTPPSYAVMNDAVGSHFYDWISERHVPTEKMPSADGWPGGFKINMGGKWVEHYTIKNAPDNTILYFSDDCLVNYEGESGWFETPGMGKMIPLGNKLGWTIPYFSFWNMYSKKPRGLLRLNDVTQNNL